jgi:hypothetical protein
MDCWQHLFPVATNYFQYLYAELLFATSLVMLNWENDLYPELLQLCRLEKKNLHIIGIGQLTGASALLWSLRTNLL